MECDFPPSQDLSHIKIGEDVELFIEDNLWQVRVQTEGKDVNDAVEKAKKVADNKLTLFQVFLAGSSTPFSIYRLDKVSDVEDLTTGKRIMYDVNGTASIITEASVIVPSNIQRDLKKLGNVSNSLLGERDCRIVLYYYARAMKESDDLYKFLNYITTIEAMLGESQEITEKIARRLAILISSKYPDLQETYEKFREFYKTRSEILHGGKEPHLSKETVDTVSSFTRVAVRNYILLRCKYGDYDIIRKFDRFFDANELEQIKQDTSF